MVSQIVYCLESYSIDTEFHTDRALCHALRTIPTRYYPSKTLEEDQHSNGHRFGPSVHADHMGSCNQFHFFLSLNNKCL